MRIGGHVAPEEQWNAFSDATVFEDAHGLLKAVFIGGEEEHRNAVGAFVRQKAAALLRFLPKEAMWDLEKDARAVTGVGFQADTAAVLEVHEYGERIVHHLVGTNAFQVRQCADATSIMFERSAVERLLRARRSAAVQCFTIHVIPLFTCFGDTTLRMHCVLNIARLLHLR